MDLQEYLKSVSDNETVKIPLGIKTKDNTDVYIRVLRTQKWADFLKFVTEFTALEGKTDPVSLRKSKELTLEMVCKMVVNEDNEPYLTPEALASMPAMMVAKIDAAVSNYILEAGKAENVENLKKN